MGRDFRRFAKAKYETYKWCIEKQEAELARKNRMVKEVNTFPNFEAGNELITMIMSGIQRGEKHLEYLKDGKRKAKAEWKMLKEIKITAEDMCHIQTQGFKC